MSDPRVIKKYPNRRLYDTVESRYITLADVRRLVVEKIDFVVVDKKNNADITRSILLQVIAEQEHLPEPISDAGLHGQRDPLLRKQCAERGERTLGADLEAVPESEPSPARAAEILRQPRSRLAAPSRGRRLQGSDSGAAARREKDRDESNLTK
jgi:hypothetical protein